MHLQIKIYKQKTITFISKDLKIKAFRYSGELELIFSTVLKLYIYRPMIAKKRKISKRKKSQ